jgi:hypothetical protein
MAGNKKSSTAVFSIPLHFLASNSREDGVFHDGALLGSGDRLFCPCATFGAAGWGLTLRSGAHNRSATAYTPRASDTTVFGCLPQFGGRETSLYTLSTCGLKGDEDGADWITRRSDGILSKWQQDPDLCHNIQGVPSLVVCARIF